MEVMLKIIEPWLFRRLEQPPTLHKRRPVQLDLSKIIFQLAAPFLLLAGSPSTTQFSRKLLMLRIEQVHQLLRTQDTQEPLLILKMIKISELHMQKTFLPLTMIRTEIKNNNRHRRVKVLHSLQKRQKTVQLATTSLVSTKEINVYLRNETLQLPNINTFSAFRKVTWIWNLWKSKNWYAHNYWRKGCYQNLRERQDQGQR